MEIQAILFNINSWDTKKAREWLKKHGYNPIKRVHKTQQFLRYRLIEPTSNVKYRVKEIGQGIKYIFEIK
jgi:arsenate reductase-like glutaredoxin family protein